MRSESDDPSRFAKGAILHLSDGTSREIISVRPTDKGILIRFAGVNDRNQAEALQGETLMVEETRRRNLGPDEFWPDQLVGLAVVDFSSGEGLGSVVGYVEGVGQDRLEVDCGGEVIEIPFVAALVPQVDLESGTVRVNLIDGLIPSRSPEP